MKCPQGALAWLVRGAGHFAKAVVEGERVADGVPAAPPAGSAGNRGRGP